MSPLHPAVGACVFAGFAAVGYADARRLRTRFAVTIETTLRHAWYVGGAAALLLVMLIGEVILFVRPSLGWHLPLAVEFAYARIVNGFILAVFAFVFSVSVFVARDTQRRDFWKILAFGLIATVGVEGLMLWKLRPLYDQITTRERDGIVLQSTRFSCGAASAANYVRLFGVVRDEREMARLLGTNELGTSSAQIVYALRDLGFACVREAIADQGPVRAPAILLLDGYGVGHAITLLGPAKRPGKWRVADPMSGVAIVDETVLRDELAGRAIRCSSPMK